jgi:hypothetical protein
MRNLLATLRPRGWAVLWWILGLGLLLRLCVMVFYTPTVFNYYGGDSTRYIRLSFVGIHSLFGDNAMPAGYPSFLAVLRDVSAWLPLTTMVQHVLGLAAAGLLYAAVVRLGAPRWAALLPVVIVVFSGDQIFLEHGIFTEALWTPLLALGLYLVARSVSAERARWWLVTGGAALACSALVRHVSQVLPVLVTVWAAVALPGSPGARLRNAAAVLLPAMLVIGAYFVVAKPVAGGYSGLVENQGFSLYGRIAQFADCTKFKPPNGTQMLCVDTPSEMRPGPFYWTFSAQSPIRTRMQFNQYDAHQQALLSSFARAAILHEPIDYLRTVTKDVLRFFAPGLGTPRPDSGTDAQSMSFESVVPAAQGASLEQLADQFDEKYSGVGSGKAAETARTLLGGYQEIFRVQGLLTLLLILLAAIGAVVGRGAMRAGASLFLLSGAVLLVFPPLFSSYDVRYAVPPINLFAAGAAFGLAVLVARIGAGRLPPTAAADGSSSSPTVGARER